MKILKWGSLPVTWLRLWREYGTVIMILAALLAVLLLAPLDTFGGGGVEGLANEDGANDVASPDPDLKCTGSEPATCTPADIIRLGYDISLDPRMSTLELTNIQDVYKSRGSSAAAMITPFLVDTTMLRAATMYNADSNEAEIQKLLDEMKKKKSPCYTNDFMATAKGFLVGSKEQKTLTVAQSEAVRCYAHRFNGIRKCLDACS